VRAGWQVDFFEFVHFFAHVADGDEEEPAPLGVLHEGVLCDVCVGDVHGTRYVSTKRSNIQEGGHLSTYDLCAACKTTPAAVFGEPYVALETPDSNFTPWPKSACNCDMCKPAPAPVAAAAPAPVAAAAPAAPEEPALYVEAPVKHVLKKTGVSLAPTTVETKKAPAQTPAGGCCIIA
jgi:hypothetical protein